MSDRPSAPSRDDSLRERAAAIHRRLEAACSADSFRSWDPFDGLSSRVFAATPLARSAFARLAWLQLFKRSPVNLRSVLLVPKLENAVSFAVAARAYAVMGRPQEQARAIDRLLALRGDPAAWGDAAWGYPFDWQARAFWVPKDMPNVIAIAYAVRALAEVRSGDAYAHQDLLRSAAAFVAGRLRREGPRGVYLGYVPPSDAMVHNANLWGAYVLAQGAAAGGPADWASLARQAIDYSLAAQRPDGAWVYGEASHHQYVDGFHTGYNLEALSLCGELLATSDFREPCERGLRFYMDRLFDADGAPRYYVDARDPIDCNGVAQGVITLLMLDGERQRRLADKVVAFALDNMWLEAEGHFAYQRRGARLQKTRYIRWTQVWMMLALGLWLAAE